MAAVAKTLQTIELIRARLNAILWQGNPLFERVLLYDAVDWERAARELYAWSGRMAAVVVRGATFDTQASGTRLYVHRLLQCTCIMTTRTFADRQQAVFDPDAPGLLPMLDAVAAAVPGDLGNGVVAVPVSASMADLSMTGKEPGRVVAQMDINLVDNIVHIPLNTTSWRPR